MAQTNAAHTPGPWVADGVFVKAVQTPFGSYTAAHCTDTDIGPREVREANARLIAAAPDYDAAARLFLACFDAYAASNPAACAAFEEAAWLARAAVEKATYPA